MKFLLIAYYFGNSTDVGAQRWNKNIKYIQELGWEPVVYSFTQQNQIENQFEIIINNQIEPNRLYKFLFNKKVPSDILTSTKKKFWNKLLVFIRSNFFIPDSRVLSIFSSKRTLRKRLKKNDIDIIISTGPPHSMHLIAKTMSEEFNIPWITDFRDPWTGIEYFEKLPLLPFARRVHQKLEQKILTSCNQVITVSDSWATHFKELGANKVSVIHNGFDHEDFLSNSSEPKQLSIAHFGTYPKSRNHIRLWNILDELCKDDAFKNALSIHFYGFIYEDFKNELKDYSFFNRIEVIDPLPHKEATKKMSEYRFLFLSLSKTSLSEGRIPLKFFEYLATGRKIIATGKKDTDLSKLINKLNCGYYINYGEESKLKKILKTEFTNPNTPSHTKNNEFIEFSKKNQAKKYVQLFNKVNNLKNSTLL